MARRKKLTSLYKKGDEVKSVRVLGHHSGRLIPTGTQGKVLEIVDGRPNVEWRDGLCGWYYDADIVPLAAVSNPKRAPKRTPKRKAKRATKPKRARRASKRNPTLSYGVVPSLAQLKDAWPADGFRMRLNQRDERTLVRAFAAWDARDPKAFARLLRHAASGNELTPRELHQVILVLMNPHRRGASATEEDEASELASSIVSVLGFEWV